MSIHHGSPAAPCWERIIPAKKARPAPMGSATNPADNCSSSRSRSAASQLRCSPLARPKRLVRSHHSFRMPASKARNRACNARSLLAVHLPKGNFARRNPAMTVVPLRPVPPAMIGVTCSLIRTPLGPAGHHLVQ